MARKKKQRQTQLTFEPVGSSDSPGQASPSPANVRFTKGVGAKGDADRASQQATSGVDISEGVRSKKHGLVGPSQKTVLPMSRPSARFMPKLQVYRPLTVGNDSSDEDSANRLEKKCAERCIEDNYEEEDEATQEEGNAIPKSSQSISTMLHGTGLEAKDEDEDDDDDDDDEIIIQPSARKRSRAAIVELEDSSDEIASPSKKRKTLGRLQRPVKVSSSPTKRPPRRHRTKKQKQAELLRRRRAGEKIDKVTSSEESDGDKRGIYDSNSDDSLDALKEFDDDEESEEEAKSPPTRQLNRSKESGKERQTRDQDEEEEDNLDDFVVEDDDAPLGAPAHLDIPLQFTSQAHRPLKDQFPFVIEWLVHNRINPAFDRNDPLYMNAWRKLNDEVQALASSKFTSSAWKVDFFRSLKGRPQMAVFEMSADDMSSGLWNVCDACGRSNHPASRIINFEGPAYYKDTLTIVETDSSSEDDEDSDDDTRSIDTQGQALPPVSKEWHVGIVCCTNAETAHSLIHWKWALKDWVEDRLRLEGWMGERKLKEREEMKDGKRRKLANKIVDGWREEKVVASLYSDFKNTLENARQQATSRRRRGFY